MKKFIFLAMLAACMLQGCADEPMTGDIATRGLVPSTSQLTVHPQPVQGYFQTAVTYVFTANFPGYPLDVANSGYYIRWTLGSWDPMGPIGINRPTFSHRFTQPGTYHVTAGLFHTSRPQLPITTVSISCPIPSGGAGPVIPDLN